MRVKVKVRVEVRKVRITIKISASNQADFLKDLIILCMMSGGIAAI